MNLTKRPSKYRALKNLHVHWMGLPSCSWAFMSNSLIAESASTQWRRSKSGHQITCLLNILRFDTASDAWICNFLFYRINFALKRQQYVRSVRIMCSIHTQNPRNMMSKSMRETWINATEYLNNLLCFNSYFFNSSDAHYSFLSRHTNTKRKGKKAKTKTLLRDVVSLSLSRKQLYTHDGREILCYIQLHADL